MDVDFVIQTYRLTAMNCCKSVGLFRSVYDFASLQKKIDKIETIWRLRTYDFMSKKVFEHNPTRVQYLRNCIPSLGNYGKSVKGLQLCRFYSCPWCWNRKYCGNVFKILSKHKTEYPQTKFYYFKYEKFYPKTQYKNCLKLIKTAANQTTALNKKLTRRLSVLGGASLVYLEPKQDGFNIIVKLIVSAKKPVQLENSFTPIMVSSNCSRVSFNFGKYPFAMLNRKNITKGFVFFLKGINKSIRRTSYYGKLYKA